MVFLSFLMFALVPLSLVAFIRWFLFDGFAEAWSREVSRTHFGRPSFAIWVDKDGKLQVHSGENPDHSTRCQRAIEMEHNRLAKFAFFLHMAIWNIIFPAVLLALLATVVASIESGSL